jgi:hypothetical protein
MWDFVLKEQQEEKIRYIVNGFESILERKAQEENEMFIYFDVLNSLRIREIDYILSAKPEGETICEFVDGFDIEKFISPEQMYIRNKLERYGLIEVQYIKKEQYSMTAQKIRLTKFGQAFLSYFKMNDLDE